jgi:hypothetical protein
MTNEETAILLISVGIAMAAMIALQWKAFKLFTFIMVVAIVFYAIMMFSDREEPREPNQTILEQMREKWRNKEEEPIDGRSD